MNFQDNATRKTGAISYLLYHQLRSQLQQRRRAREIRQRQAGVFPADGASSGATMTTAVAGLQDRGVPRHGRLGRRWSPIPTFSSTTASTTASHRRQACEIKPTWNAAVCKGDVGRLSIGGRRRRRRVAVLALPAVLAVAGAPARRCRRCGGRLRELAAWRGWRPAAGARGPEAVPDARDLQPPVRSQPQWQGLHRRPGNQRTRRYRDQGDHRKAVPVPQREGTGQRLVGDLRAAGIHHRSLGYAAEQPGCAAQGQRHLVLQGQRFALGQACLHGDVLAAALARP